MYITEGKEYWKPYHNATDITSRKTTKLLSDSHSTFVCSLPDSSSTEVAKGVIKTLSSMNSLT